MWIDVHSVVVPADRLQKNLEAKLAKSPKDYQTMYLLGRLHSLLFAQDVDKVQVHGTEENPSFYGNGVAGSLKRPRLTVHQLDELLASLAYYRKALSLQPNNSLYRLGFAWMHEQAAEHPDQVGVLSWIGESPATKDQLVAEAIKDYRLVMDADMAKDLQRKGPQRPGDLLSWEAGLGLMRVGKGRLPQAELDKIKANVIKLAGVGHSGGVTPIILPLYGRKPADSLIDNRARIKFPLMGTDGMEWPWIRPNAGFLVWDPNHTGKIKSGRQMFGSVTFMMLFSDGYAALSTLDDNSDGWLRGKELDGIAIWNDRNSNGKSDPGEVRPLAAWGIVALKTRPTQQLGTLTADGGAVFRDGRSVPTYDWMPTSWKPLAPNARPIALN